MYYLGSFSIVLTHPSWLRVMLRNIGRWYFVLVTNVCKLDCKRDGYQAGLGDFSFSSGSPPCTSGIALEEPWPMVAG